jgi:hypothetical protein
MEFELKIYAIIVPTENDFIIYINNISILQMYVIAQNERILHDVVQRFSEHNFDPPPYSSAPTRKIMIRRNLWVCLWSFNG